MPEVGMHTAGQQPEDKRQQEDEPYHPCIDPEINGEAAAHTGYHLTLGVAVKAAGYVGIAAFGWHDDPQQQVYPEQRTK